MPNWNWDSNSISPSYSTSTYFTSRLEIDIEYNTQTADPEKAAALATSANSTAADPTSLVGSLATGFADAGITFDVISSVPELSLLAVEARAERFGRACSDLYFESLDLTSTRVDELSSWGLRFSASVPNLHVEAGWLHIRHGDVKVRWGHTAEGVEYINVFVRHLSRAGFPVGGLLGDGDHSKLGKLIGALTILNGIIVLAMPIGVVGANFSAEYYRVQDEKKRRVKLKQQMRTRAQVEEEQDAALTKATGETDALESNESERGIELCRVDAARKDIVVCAEDGCR
ncbi:unnamed protein product [Prorocentrum cordatum]|uniref:Potassium channel domain-containing protein n=1 Tax=Prorocentrum cordatum TaxID=2364126 RepID=A0ABN9UR35_9DINO|nr:unnamed protein product [Polarella glacialis]